MCHDLFDGCIFRPVNQSTGLRWLLVVQDEDHLYLMMEYLPGGDVMVRYNNHCAFMQSRRFMQTENKLRPPLTSCNSSSAAWKACLVHAHAGIKALL